MDELVIRGARVFGAGVPGGVEADVAVAHGEVRAVRRADAATPPLAAAREEVDGRGLYLLPGLVDDHVHFREPGREDKEDFASGSAAAAHGGVTTVIEIQNNAPLMTRRENVDAKLALVRPKSRVNVGLYGSANASSVGFLRDMADVVLGFKIFLAPSHGDAGVDSDATLLALFQEAARCDRVVVVHAEDKAAIEQGLRQHAADGAAAWSRARPAAAEVMAVERALRIAERTGARTHVFHVSAAGSVDLLADAKERGLPVTGATCPHYLLFTDQDVAARGGLLKVNPSIKGERDRARLREGVRDGTIDVLESDHAPHLPAEKAAPFSDNPSGISCADVLLPVYALLIEQGVLTWDLLIERASRAPARLFRIPKKGTIAAGEDADLVLVRPRAWTPAPEDFRSKASLSPYAGLRLPAQVERTWVCGRQAFP